MCVCVCVHKLNSTNSNSHENAGRDSRVSQHSTDSADLIDAQHGREIGARVEHEQQQQQQTGANEAVRRLGGGSDAAQLCAEVSALPPVRSLLLSLCFVIPYAKHVHGWSLQMIGMHSYS